MSYKPAYSVCNKPEPVIFTVRIVKTIVHMLRHVNTIKMMSIRSKLICIVWVHTECILTTICFEGAFSQSTYIGSLKPVWR